LVLLLAGACGGSDTPSAAAASEADTSCYTDLIESYREMTDAIETSLRSDVVDMVSATADLVASSTDRSIAGLKSAKADFDGAADSLFVAGESFFSTKESADVTDCE
jgi:hypothetical protein